MVSNPLSDFIHSIGDNFTGEAALMFSVFIVLVCAILVIFLGRKLKLPLIIGYFITGILVGPSVLGLVTTDQVELLADLGIILLMFTIGLEISLKNLLSMKRIVLIGGGIQVCLTTIAMWLIMHFIVGLSPNTSFLVGMMVATSSTAIVLSLYQKSGETEQRHGKIALGILIFQDLAVIPMMLICPILAGSDTSIVDSLIDLAIGIVILFIVLVAAIHLVPRILQKVAQTRSSELFIITVVVICFGIAGAMSLAGISLALGAFLAGIAISESDYCHEVIGQVMPLRDILTSFFFVSIGMMLNLSYFFEHIVTIVLIAAAVLIIKSLVNFVSIKAIGHVAAGTALLSGIGLAQIGEFSFVLGTEGMNLGFLSEEVYQIFLGIALLTMIVTPLLIKLGPKAAAAVSKDDTKQKQPGAGTYVSCERSDSHVIIVGYGLAGRYVASALKKVQMPYIIIEMNPDTVAAERKKGENIVYGDASHKAMLEFADISHAQTLVVSIPNMDSVKAIISLARRMNPKIGIITRSRFIAETPTLYKLGADEVIVDEREAAIQAFRRILSNEQVPLQDIDLYAQQLRNDMYNKYIETPINSRIKREDRGSSFMNSILLNIRRSEEKESVNKSFVEQVRVEEGSAVANKMLSEVHLRGDFGVSVIAVRKAGADAVVSPDGETRLCPGDLVVVIGERESIQSMTPLFVRG
ncbi:MAG TPA: cation:proton antiporter [Methanocorpusculum sp.]|nr:cation:proton antiporter [Methanocorpusculum sp.]